MAVETKMGIGETLNNYNTREWVKSSQIDGTQHKLKVLDGFPLKSSHSDRADHKSFIDFLGDSVNRVNELQKNANLAMEKLASGKSKNIHETMLAVEHAELAFKAMNQVRSKVIDAYREIMRMQI